MIAQVSGVAGDLVLSLGLLVVILCSASARRSVE